MRLQRLMLNFTPNDAQIANGKPDPLPLPDLVALPTADRQVPTHPGRLS